jgi:hypothetical protein
MSKLVLRLALLGALIGFAVYYQNQQNAALNTAASRGAKMRELLLPGLQIENLRRFVIRDEKNSVSIQVANDLKSATLTERGGYPASIDKLSTVMSDLREQKIASKVPVGKSAWSKAKLKAPGESGEGIGTQVEMIDGNGKAFATLILGSNTDISGAANANPMMGMATQRLVRNLADDDTIWQVNNTFFDLEAKAENWLDKAFIDVQKIKQIAITAAKPEEGWSISRAKDSDTDFVLDSPKAGESLDNSKITASSILSAASFNDVNSKDKAAELLKGATKARITTFDGFAYDLQIAKTSKDGSDKYFLSLAVSAEIPKTRTAAKGEKEEDKKKADEAFNAEKKTKEEKLAKEKKLEGWVYDVSEYTVNNLLKKRAEIVKVEAPKPASPPAPAAPAPAAPAPAAPAK